MQQAMQSTQHRTIEVATQGARQQVKQASNAKANPTALGDLGKVTSTVIPKALGDLCKMTFTAYKV